ncbi:hypothetical protein [Mycolicibacterium fortuitum]|uniref:Uncharacterized protein n=1 Tax=Mycolicibacterium fortuitum TaxID=1766 RepID=A0AAE4V7T9_MYCFO|nr:hypothetical protein [Mycolicibacterium fortuitum]MDV7194625.1 hypothetical protein [Mycolicibacterium fortuitum]MDV7208625.1 hypothetical protein [Mycolicibacterium fortuitum]MDV7230522.1 hypothetical protein [Mycolicibacterium fortuitum]MDV7261871.1 hypothetical protein [Mycolicibacterium fortuitum]MDV7288742.1 hypothetical protein [Mycolicibacterium fortuitum]
MSDAYALKQPHPNGGEWIQEFDSLAEAVQYRKNNGGVLVRREPLPGEPGLWWVEVKEWTIGMAIESGQGPDGLLSD